MKTENLAILMTDIAGYTEATAHLSRKDNERLLENHNRILLPIIRRFKGTLVKTIGDALLMVFRSPTDAMLCAMAMQDALFEYNRELPEDQQIHIRVAASLGEVRVTRNDIFGEPVNTTSRIEGITPQDEIYLSDAVYMAMNKAEVPCREVGLRQLKGISEQVRIWEIPRFSRPRLVPEDAMSAEDISEIVFPFGGAHLMGRRDETSMGDTMGGRRLWTAAVFALILAATAAAFYYVGTTQTDPGHSAGVTPAVVTAAEPGAPDHAQAADDSAPGSGEDSEQNETASESGSSGVALAEASPAVQEPVRQKPVPVKPEPVRETPAPITTASLRDAPSTAPAPPAEKPYKVLVKEPHAGVEIVPLDEEEDPETSFTEMKKALRAGTLTREEYNEQIREAKLKLREELQAAREEYSAGQLDRRAYKERVTEIKQKYR